LTHKRTADAQASFARVPACPYEKGSLDPLKRRSPAAHHDPWRYRTPCWHL